MIWVPIWDQVAGIRDLDGKVFSVKQCTIFNHQEESRILKMSRKCQNPLWQEYTAANKYEQGHRKTVPWKSYFPLPYNSSSRFFCSSCSVNKSVQGKTYFPTIDIFASRHKTILEPANRPPSAAALYHHMAEWKQKWSWSHQPVLQFLRYRTSPHTLLPRASPSACSLKGRC